MKLRALSLLAGGMVLSLLLVHPAQGAAAQADRAAPGEAKAAIEAIRPSPNLQTGREGIADWQARLELARVLSYMKRYDESIVQYRRVLTDKPDLAEARMELARVYYWNNQPDQAMALFEKLDQAALPPEERLILADLLLAQKKYSRAEEILRALLKAKPEDAKTRLKLAEVLSWTKRYDESIKEYQIILKALPEDKQIRRKYAFVLIWNGQHEQAAKELAKTLD